MLIEIFRQLIHLPVELFVRDEAEKDAIQAGIDGAMAGLAAATGDVAALTKNGADTARRYAIEAGRHAVSATAKAADADPKAVDGVTRFMAGGVGTLTGGPIRATAIEAGAGVAAGAALGAAAHAATDGDIDFWEGMAQGQSLATGTVSFNDDGILDASRLGLRAVRLGVTVGAASAAATQAPERERADALRTAFALGGDVGSVMEAPTKKARWMAAVQVGAQAVASGAAATQLEGGSAIRALQVGRTWAHRVHAGVAPWIQGGSPVEAAASTLAAGVAGGVEVERMQVEQRRRLTRAQAESVQRMQVASNHLDGLATSIRDEPARLDPPRRPR